MTDKGLNMVLHCRPLFQEGNDVEGSGRDCLYCVRTCGRFKVCGTRPWISRAKSMSVMVHSVVDSIYHYAEEDNMEFNGISRQRIRSCLEFNQTCQRYHV